MDELPSFDTGHYGYDCLTERSDGTGTSGYTALGRQTVGNGPQNPSCEEEETDLKHPYIQLIPPEQENTDKVNLHTDSARRDHPNRAKEAVANGLQNPPFEHTKLEEKEADLKHIHPGPSQQETSGQMSDTDYLEPVDVSAARDHAKRQEVSGQMSDTDYLQPVDTSAVRNHSKKEDVADGLQNPSFEMTKAGEGTNLKHPHIQPSPPQQESAVHITSDTEYLHLLSAEETVANGLQNPPFEDFQDNSHGQILDTEYLHPVSALKDRTETTEDTGGRERDSVLTNEYIEIISDDYDTVGAQNDFQGVSTSRPLPKVPASSHQDRTFPAVIPLSPISGSQRASDQGGLPEGSPYDTLDSADTLRKTRASRKILCLIIAVTLSVAAIVFGVVFGLLLSKTETNNTTTAPSSPFLCGVGNPEYIPMADTFPDNCGKFQLCSGPGLSMSQVLSCENGTEFTDEVDTGPCIRRDAGETYCEKRETSSARTTTPASSTQTVTIATTAFSTQTFTTATTAFSTQTFTTATTAELSAISLTMSNRAPIIGQNFTLFCTITNTLFNVSTVELLHDDQFLGSYNATFRESTTARPGISISASDINLKTEVNLTFWSFTCSDAGNYTCIARDDGGDPVNSHVTVSLRELPEALTLTMKKELVESQTTDNPSCSTSSVGYNPAYVFSWVLKRNNGTTIESLPPSRQADTYVYDSGAECGQTTGSSSLDAQKYVGWNESVLCCQLTDPADTSDVYAEACSEEIKLVPDDYCSSRSDQSQTILLYPFETCFTYIQCVTGRNTIYFNKCSKSVGLCLDVDAGLCSQQPTTTTDPDATTTTPSPSARFTCTSVTDYRPYSDTYPDKCNKFQWCVNGKSHNQTCPGAGHEFTWEKDGDPTCAEPSDSTYCGKLRLLETTPSPGTGSTEAQSTTTVVTTTIGPFECGGNNPEYIPRADTYPDNCGHYRRCYGLNQHIDDSCQGEGQFAYGGAVCINPGSGNSYCEQRAAAESGRSTTMGTP